MCLVLINNSLLKIGRFWVVTVSSGSAFQIRDSSFKEGAGWIWQSYVHSLIRHEFWWRLFVGEGHVLNCWKRSIRSLYKVHWKNTCWLWHDGYVMKEVTTINTWSQLHLHTNMVLTSTAHNTTITDDKPVYIKQLGAPFLPVDEFIGLLTDVVSVLGNTWREWCDVTLQVCTH